MAELIYRRALLKLSGEALAGEKHSGIDPQTVSRICAEIADVARLGLEVALVIGGGNIFRGLSASAEVLPVADRMWQALGLSCRWLDGTVRQQWVGHLPFARRATVNGGFSVRRTGSIDPNLPDDVCRIEVDFLIFKRPVGPSD